MKVDLITDTITSYGTSCPSQWNATATNGVDVYIRYRFGCLTVQHAQHDFLIYNRAVGRGLDGDMSTIDMLCHLRDGDGREGFPDDD